MSNSTAAELCIQNAYIPGRGLSDISIDQGKIISFSEPGETLAYNEVHDLKGWLLVPAMAEPHAHLDKALTADIVPNPSGELMGAITLLGSKPQKREHLRMRTQSNEHVKQWSCWSFMG